MSHRPNQVRIIAGKWRGRKVDFLPSAQLRPTGDKIRETAFNWLQNDIDAASCLDLFSGSGIFGFEALSRGAGHVVMVDLDPQVSNKIRENAERLTADNFDIWLEQIPNPRLQTKLSQQQFDIVFIDPPFQQGLVAPSCAMLIESGCLKDGSLIYIETERSLELAIPEQWKVLRAKAAGNVAYYLIQN